jgi:hypothetical protein
VGGRRPALPCPALPCPALPCQRSPSARSAAPQVATSARCRCARGGKTGGSWCHPLSARPPRTGPAPRRPRPSPCSPACTPPSPCLWWTQGTTRARCSSSWTSAPPAAARCGCA